MEEELYVFDFQELKRQQMEFLKEVPEGFPTPRKS
jgi:hypothetical protein